MQLISYFAYYGNGRKGIILNHSLFFPLPVLIVKAKFNHACLWPEHQTAALELFLPGISIISNTNKYPAAFILVYDN